jgi:hypothetical protein
MRILCVYYQDRVNVRNTVNEHLYSLRRYSNQECYYLNVALGIPSYVSSIHFDLVVYHYTFFALKWDFKKFEKLKKRYSRLKYVRGYSLSELRH